MTAWMDLLGEQGLGSLPHVARIRVASSVDGRYLSHLRNQRADTRTGRVPDENSARVGDAAVLDRRGAAGWIGLPGSPTLPMAGRHRRPGPGVHRLELGVSRTGWTTTALPTVSAAPVRPGRLVQAHAGYLQYHSAGEELPGRDRRAAGPARSAGQPGRRRWMPSGASCVGPFIGQQLIQRLVTSNPSADLRGRGGQGVRQQRCRVRGDLKAVVKGDPDGTPRRGRSPTTRASCASRCCAWRPTCGAGGCQRERLLAWATPTAPPPLGQTPLRAPSVFNFTGLATCHPGTQAAAAGWWCRDADRARDPTAGYVNAMRDFVGWAWAPAPPAASATCNPT